MFRRCVETIEKYLRLRKSPCITGSGKGIVYSREIRDVEDFRASITAAIATLTTTMLLWTFLELDYRLDILKASKESYVEVQCFSK
ncbi:hypothetical protein AVEN_171110-1 [Araneus ventricosus]|uniref:Uncharacterized protein n=1 Tax=Araneus ventricosus TaxID=182803 RepID=A0A4Y2Q1Q1_ARAVE|nr:hypothetical protein AVEN_171110-1 [Araneus ventricosus]